MNNRGECFIPWSRGGWIAGYEKTGTLIKFSGYVHTCKGGKLEQRIHWKRSRSSLFFFFIKINYIFINPPVRFPRRNAAAAAGDQEGQLVERRAFLHYTSLGFLKGLPHAVLNRICMLSYGIKNFYG
jgi:hypothetical protein